MSSALEAREKRLRSVWPGSRRVLIAIVFLALIVRLVAAWSAGAGPLSSGEGPRSHDAAANWGFGFEAGQIAGAVAEGRGFSSPFPGDDHPTGWLMPGYPLLLAGSFKIFGPYSRGACGAMVLLQCVVSALTCVLVFGIGKRGFGHATGYLAAALLALYPPSVWYASTTIWDTTIFTFLAMLLLVGLLDAPKRLDARSGALCGAVLGLCALINAAILAFLPAILLWLGLSPDTTRGRRIKCVGAMLGVLAALLTPWVVRNAVVLGSPVLRSNWGVEFRLGNNPEAWRVYAERGSLIRFSETRHPSMNGDELVELRRLGEVRYANACAKDALEFVRANPIGFARLTAVRFRDFWLGNREAIGWKGKGGVVFDVSWAKRVCYVATLPLAIVGVVAGIRRRRESRLLLGYLLLLPVVYYVTQTHARYKYPLDPVLLVLASFAVCLLVRRVRAGTVGTGHPQGRGVSCLQGPARGHDARDAGAGGGHDALRRGRPGGPGQHLRLLRLPVRGDGGGWFGQRERSAGRGLRHLTGVAARVGGLAAAGGRWVGLRAEGVRRGRRWAARDLRGRPGHLRVAHVILLTWHGRGVHGPHSEGRHWGTASVGQGSRVRHDIRSR